MLRLHLFLERSVHAYDVCANYTIIHIIKKLRETHVQLDGSIWAHHKLETVQQHIGEIEEPPNAFAQFCERVVGQGQHFKGGQIAEGIGARREPIVVQPKPSQRAKMPKLCSCACVCVVYHHVVFMSVNENVSEMEVVDTWSSRYAAVKQTAGARHANVGNQDVQT
jgi:hypothetical protein